MTLWWVLGLIIVAFIIGYLIMSPRKKLARDEHIEPRNMRTGDPVEEPKKPDDIRRIA